MNSFICTVHSKINIFMRILKRKENGYHEIETIFLPLKNPQDTITVSSEKNGLTVTSSGIPIPLNKDNICYKAAVEFAKAANIPPAWSIHIDKKIPVAAGLGGGSSDAAAVLNKLREKHPGVENKTFLKIASSLGADVPFFLNPVPSSASGVGEKIQPLENIPELYLVIVNPLFPISAAWGYNNYITDERTSSVDDAVNALKSNDLSKLATSFRNDLQPAVFEKFPIMGILKKSLLEFGAEFAEMSGSGPTLFAVCKTEDKAADIAEKMRLHYTDSIYCISTSTLTWDL